MFKNRQGRGSKKRVGNVSNNMITKLLKIPKQTFKEWEKNRPELFWFLKTLTKEEIMEIKMESEILEKKYKEENIMNEKNIIKDKDTLWVNYPKEGNINQELLRALLIKATEEKDIKNIGFYLPKDVSLGTVKNELMGKYPELFRPSRFENIYFQTLK